MRQKLDILTANHLKTKRNYIERMTSDKVYCMNIAKNYGFDYWDGERKFGYGGYKYIPGWWKESAENLINQYKLTTNSKVLDIGCGKGFLLYEIQLLLPGIKITGVDSSEYAIKNIHSELVGDFYTQKAQENFSYEDLHFDLVISTGTLHNLKIYDLKKAFLEIERLGRSKFIMVESYRNDLEFFNLECWALTAQSLFAVDEWVWFFKEIGYTGDYEFIYFE